MSNVDLVELWRSVDNGEVLFSGTLLKKSEILGRWNERFVHVVRVTRDVIVCLYWRSQQEAVDHPHEPRGILNASDATLSCEVAQLELEIRHVHDMLRDSDCFGSRADILVVLKVESYDEFLALCGALGSPVAEEVPAGASAALAYEKERKPKSDQTQANRLGNEYDILGELGRGAFSIVYRAKLKKEPKSKELAVKVVMLSNLSPRERKTQFRYLNSEVDIMRKVRDRLKENKHVVHLLESFAETKPEYRVCMILELCNGGELFDRIVKRSHFSEKDAKDVIQKLAATLRDLHNIGIVHRDIKPENLIYDSPADDATIKLTDFGLAMDTEFPEKDVYKSFVVGTCGYFAPEVMQLRYTPACDIWSLGVVLYILLVGYPPFVGKTRLQVQKEIRFGRYQFHMPEWKDISLSARDLISKMLEVNIKKRITPSGILQHPWIVSADTEQDKPLALKKHKQFNTRRKLKAAAYAVMLGSRLSKHSKEKLGKLAKDINPGQLKTEDLNMIKNSFERHSQTNSSGKEVVTSTTQLQNILTELGYNNLPLERMFSVFDENKDGIIDQRELLSGLAALQGPGEEAIRFCFDVYDEDGSGDIDKDELAQILSMCITNTRLNPEKIAHELSEAFEDIDTDGNGTISFNEFQTACHKKPYLVNCLLSRKLKSSSNLLEDANTELLHGTAIQ